MEYHILEVEKPLIELEKKIEELKKVNLDGRVDLAREIKFLEEKAKKLKKDIYENLSAWDKVQIARHPKRPSTLEYIKDIFVDFFEMHGDRLLGDDSAIVGGLARLEDRTVVVMGHQKGKDTKENLKRNFGMSNPEGFRKAARLMKFAEKFSYPIISFVDTPGAYPGIEAEERGQYEAIASNVALMMRLQVPIIIVVIGEGGSGGALAIGVGDKVIMLENSIYSVISPEGCASILWRNSSLASKAAESLKLTSQDLKKFGIIDEIVPEPFGGVHRNPEEAYKKIKEVLIRELDVFSKISSAQLIDLRYEKYKKMAVYQSPSL